MKLANFFKNTYFEEHLRTTASDDEDNPKTIMKTQAKKIQLSL